MPRTVVSALKIGKSLDSGCFGTVHEGIHPIHGDVAIKVIKRDPKEKEKTWDQRRDDLLNEGQRLKDAEHERIVRVFDISHDAKEDKIYLILELCPQGSLKNQYNNGPIELGLLHGWITDIAMGLGCIHSRNLLHRDIKPANILMSNDGRVKVGDFGLVTDNLIFGYGSMHGYIDHIAKEVWTDKKTSVRSDIWAFGMTIYRLLHGQVYYDELDPPRNKVRLGGYANSLKWLPHIPKAWKTFVKKCLRDDPTKRYQNAQQVLSALSALPFGEDWLCTYTSSKTTWERQKGTRLQLVTHTIHSPRRHEWNSTSMPATGIGRSRHLAGSNGVTNKSSALKGLEEYFRTS